MRLKRSGNSPLRPRSVWLKTARLLKSAPPPAADVRKPISQVRVPDGLLGGLRGEQNDSLALVKHEPLDQHQPDEGLPSPTPSQRNAPPYWRLIFMSAQ